MTHIRLRLTDSLHLMLASSLAPSSPSNPFSATLRLRVRTVPLSPCRGQAGREIRPPSP